MHIGDRVVKDKHHRMARPDNISLITITTTSIRTALYHTDKEAGLNTKWDDIKTEQFSANCVIMDKDYINLNKPVKDLKDDNGNKVHSERQLREQRIAYADASGFNGTASLK